MRKAPLHLVGMRHRESENNAAYKLAHEKRDNKFLRRLEAVNRPDALDRSTRRGIAAVDAARQWLAGCFIPKYGPFDAYFTSDMIRAQETAGTLFPDADWHISSNLHERDWGAFFRKAPEHWGTNQRSFDRRQQDPFHWRPKRGVTLAEGLPSTREFLREELAPHEGESAFFASHGERLWKVRYLNEGMTPMEFREAHFSKREEDAIHNCTIHHYSRLDPHTEKVEDTLCWMRVIHPDRSYESEWRKIGRKTYKGVDLLKEAEKYERVFDF